MVTFLLVHGSWHGGWCWKHVAKFLRSAGHEVFAPTLSGLGETNHLLKCGIDLGTHIQDIVNLLHYEDLKNVTLVGHSYGGMVITGVAGKSPERLERMIYLDAFVPSPGQSEFDLLGSSEHAEKDGDWQEGGKWFRPPIRLEYLGLSNLKEKEWIAERLTAHPLATYDYSMPPPDKPDRFAKIPKTYIHCTSGPSSPRFATFANKARADSWPVYELPTGHDAMLTMPNELGKLLIKISEHG